MEDVETLSLKNATPGGAPLDDAVGGDSFELPMAKELIAGPLSIQPGTFSRIMGRLIDEATLVKSGRQITIPVRQHFELFG